MACVLTGRNRGREVLCAKFFCAENVSDWIVKILFVKYLIYGAVGK